MYKTCQEICDEIEEIFGHKVDPQRLEELIESSPLTNNGEKDNGSGGEEKL